MSAARRVYIGFKVISTDREGIYESLNKNKIGAKDLVWRSVCNIGVGRERGLTSFPLFRVQGKRRLLFGESA